MTRVLDGTDDGEFDVLLDSGIDVNDGSLNRVLMEGVCSLNLF